MTPTTVFLADDHPIVRAGVRAQLERLPAVTVVGEADDGRTALLGVIAKRPDIVFLDMSMPGLSGLETLRLITQETPSVRVIVLTMHDDPEYVVGALRCGAAGYVLKHAGVDELRQAIDAVTRGQTFTSPSVTQTLADYIRDAEPATSQSTPLTHRQQEILRLIAESRHTKEIATTLKISVKTVEMHRARLMARLEIRDVAGLVRYAVRTGLVRPDM
jgi:DNA-binding NarL/FixJ family response regulator